MVLRVTFEKLSNPFMTTRLFLKLIGCSRAIVIPEDNVGHSVVIVDSFDEIGVVQKIKSTHAPLRCEILVEDFEEVVGMLEKPIKKKKAFITQLGN